MSRKDRFLLQFVVWLAIGTFLFGIWSLVMGLRKSPKSRAEARPAITNAVDATASP